MIAGTALAAAIALSPVLTLANENNSGNNSEKNHDVRVQAGLNVQLGNRNGEKNDEKKEEKKEIKNEIKDIKQEVKKDGFNWGFFNRFSWIWNWFNHGSSTHATSTPDTVAPVIRDLSVNARMTDAMVSWKTNENADSAVYFGTSSATTASTSASSVVSASLVKDHRLSLANLSASTTYYVVVKSKDAAGNVVVSNQISFTTDKNGDSVAPVISNTVYTVSTSSINIKWVTNEPAYSKVFYSRTSPVDMNASTSLSVSDGTKKTNHSITLNGLASSTLYYAVIQSTDAAGNVGTSGEVHVTTLGY